ncbi:response regulator [Brevibacterium otitidis]|uniref:Response regulator n=1 Tax=Brevibacterium otitidis TaxID=53364 RepID=A0ABV5X2U3_9MICO|nr:response regulator transcription factor [Brevibacterium otitidis]
MNSQREPAVRVLIADDQPLLLSALATVIDAVDGLEVTATAGNGAEALEHMVRHRVDVAVLDIRMPVLDGLETARRIRQQHPETAVLFLTTFNEPELVREALDAGAAGFLLKDADPTELATGIQAVSSGQPVISAAAAGHLVTAYQEMLTTARRTAPEAVPGLSTLTPREFEVFELIAQGLTNAEIADELVIGETTVKTHVSNLLLKLQCRDRIALVVLAADLRRN